MHCQITCQRNDQQSNMYLHSLIKDQPVKKSGEINKNDGFNKNGNGQQSLKAIQDDIEVHVYFRGNKTYHLTIADKTYLGLTTEY